MDAASTQSPNRLLASLPPADFELLRPHLKTIELIHEKVLFDDGEPVNFAYFPHSGVISLVVPLASGDMIEAAMVGRDSIVGGLTTLDGTVALNRGIVQIPGAASVLPVQQIRKFVEDSVAFRTTLIRHLQVLFVQAQQSAACNASHTADARLARWLLRAHDLSGSDLLPLTQEFLGQMLGLRRTSVTLVARTLQQAGLIRYSRGRIQIADLQGLNDAACECYSTVKAHYDGLLNNDREACAAA
jgi:CRP-like cAMP-binding protein